MSSDMRKNTWAYVHGELSEEERRAMEDAMRQDAALREEVANARKIYDRLRRVLPAAERTEAQLVDEILPELEQEWAAGRQAGPDPAAPPKDNVSALPRWFRQLWIPAHAYRIGLAAAAAVLFMVLPIHSSLSVRWEYDVVPPSGFRGEGGATPAYSEGELAACRTAVQTAFEQQGAGPGKTERTSWVRRRRPWRVTVGIQEVIDAQLRVVAVAYAPGRKTAEKTWKAAFADPDALASGIHAFAEEVVREFEELRSERP
ncbi:MAG: hypothetical protein JXR37_08835 [Kiritimatiellae bacterium]|nr:hypothetical protein [Kiritimatiellia bacterium]